MYNAIQTNWSKSGSKLEKRYTLIKENNKNRKIER